MNVELYDSIEAIPADLWDGISPTAWRTQSHALWRVVEQSGLNDFAYRYAVLRDEAGVAVAAVAFYTITTDLAIFAPDWLRRLLGWIRRVMPGFLMVRMLECGTPVTLTSPPFVVGDRLPPERTVTEVARFLLKLARKERHFILVVRDFESNADSLRPYLKALGFHFVRSLPNTYLDIVWPSYDAYLAAMKSYFRSKVTKHMRRNEEAGVRHVLVDDFDDLAETLCRQWMVVHTQASEFQREVLTETFYRRFSRELGADTKVLLFYRRDELVGHALLLRDRDLLRWMYFGREEAVNDSLYIYVGQTVIRTAIEMGASSIEMGLTTYPVKLDMGARVERLDLGLRAPSWIINPFVGIGYSVMNTVPEVVARDVFKNGEAEAKRGRRAAAAVPAEKASS